MAVDETGASRRSTASTAEGAALLRAAGVAERDPRVRNPDYHRGPIPKEMYVPAAY